MARPRSGWPTGAFRSTSYGHRAVKSTHLLVWCSCLCLLQLFCSLRHKRVSREHLVLLRLPYASYGQCVPRTGSEEDVITSKDYEKSRQWYRDFWRQPKNSAVSIKAAMRVANSKGICFLTGAEVSKIHLEERERILAEQNRPAPVPPPPAPKPVIIHIPVMTPAPETVHVPDSPKKEETPEEALEATKLLAIEYMSEHPTDAYRAVISHFEATLGVRLSEHWTRTELKKIREEKGVATSPGRKKAVTSCPPPPLFKPALEQPLPSPVPFQPPMFPQFNQQQPAPVPMGRPAVTLQRETIEMESTPDWTLKDPVLVYWIRPHQSPGCQGTEHCMMLDKSDAVRFVQDLKEAGVQTVSAWSPMKMEIKTVAKYEVSIG
jgi:hypothetical protein